MNTSATKHAPEKKHESTERLPHIDEPRSDYGSHPPVRARVKISSIDETNVGTNNGRMLAMEVVFEPSIHTDQLTSDELANRNATLRIEVKNPRLAKFFEVGKTYDLEFNRVTA